jgi:hypothetical protein
MEADLLAKGMLKAAVDVYAETAAADPDSPAKLYHNLLDFVHRQVTKMEGFKQATARADTETALLVSVPVWGERYIAGMGAFLIRSLLAPGNLPAVAHGRKVALEFSTRASDAAALESSGAFRDVAKVAHVSVIPYPDHLFQSHPRARDFNYRIFGAMHHLSILRARAIGNMDVVLFCADHILSDGAFAAIDAKLKAGAKLVVSAGMRIDKQAWLPALLRDLNTEAVKEHLALPPRRLVDYAIRYMHPVSRHLIASIHTRPFGGLPFPLYFPHPDGFTAHSFVLHPVAVAAAFVQRETNYDFNTVDGAFLTRVLAGQNHEAVVAFLGRDEEAHLFEVSEPANIQEAQMVAYFSPEQIAKYFFKWRAGKVESVYRWFFRQPIRFRGDKARIKLAPDDIDESKTVESILGYIGAWEGAQSAATTG